jgi:hypothetical protein
VLNQGLHVSAGVEFADVAVAFSVPTSLDSDSSI